MCVKCLLLSLTPLLWYDTHTHTHTHTHIYTVTLAGITLLISNKELPKTPTSAKLIFLIKTRNSLQGKKGCKDECTNKTYKMEKKKGPNKLHG